MSLANKGKYLSLVLIAMMFLSSLSIFSYGDTANVQEKAYLKKCDNAVAEKLKSEKRLDVIVHMTEKADLDAAKKEALNHEYGETETVERKAVIAALEDVAASSQADLTEYLKFQQSKGSVVDFESFFIINAIRVNADAVIIKEIARRDDVAKITLNRKIKQDKPIIPKEPLRLYRPTSTVPQDGIEWNIKAIGADRVWRDFNVYGDNVTVGIIDTGVYIGNPAIRDKWRGYNKITKEQKPKGNYIDYVDGKAFPEAIPANNHGTHVAGTILGSMSRASGEKYNQIGVAPGAKFISARAFDDYGGRHDTILQCAEWMLKPGGLAENAPDIVNNSWGGDNNTDPWFKEIINVWRAANIFPVFAAGNLTSQEIQQKGTITNPGSLKESFAVGAVNSENKIAAFSKWGPSLFDDAQGRIKPEIVAPGVQIRSGLASGVFASWNGTSMAAPHIAGVAALMKSANPNLKVEEIEQILKDTALPLKDNNFKSSPNMAYGYGLVSAYDAVAAVLGKGSGTVSGNVMARGDDAEDPELTLNIEETLFRGRNFTINADIKDNVAIVKAVAEYSMDDGASWNRLPLELVEGDAKSGEYAAKIKAEQISGNNLRLKIKVWDYGRKDGEPKETPECNIPIKDGVNPSNYENDFEIQTDGWYFDGIWNWGTPLNSKEPNPKSGSKCVGTDVGRDDFRLVRINSYLTMPPIDISAHHGKNFLLKYNEFLGVEPATFCAIELKVDDQPFVEIGTRERGLNPMEWQEVTYDLGKYVGDGERMEVRFKLQGPPKDEGPGWYIDDVRLTEDVAVNLPSVKGTKLKNTPDGIRITWNPSEDPMVCGYKIFRKGQNDTIWTVVKDIYDKDRGIWSDKPNKPGRYEYKVAAIDSYGNESPAEPVAIDFKKIESVFYANFEDGNGMLIDEDGWEWGVPVRTASEDPYTTLYQQEAGLFTKMKDADKVWGTMLEGRMQAGKFAVLETKEIEIPMSAADVALEFESYNTIVFSSLASNIHFKVEINTGGNTWSELVSPFAIMDFDKKARWSDIVADMNAYKGKKVKIRWVADSVRQSKTDKYELGWYIDNVRIGEASGVVTTSSDGDISRNSAMRNASEDDESSCILQADTAGAADILTVPAGVRKVIMRVRDSGTALGSGRIPVNARVSVKETGKKVVANPANGEYEFKHAESSGGTWEIIAEAYGYFTERKRINLAKGEHKKLDFELRRKGKGTIEGIVLDTTGAPVENAYLRIVEDSNYVLAKTDNQGSFKFDEVLEGDYHIRAFKSGYYGKVAEVKVIADTAVTPEIKITAHESTWEDEELNRDNGKYETQFIHQKLADGPKGYAVRYRAPKQGGMLTSTSLYVPPSKSKNNKMDVAVMAYDDDGRLVELGREDACELTAGKWNEVQLAGHNIKTDKSFYIVALQKKRGPDTVTIGIDNSNDAGKPGALNSYIYNGAFSRLESTGINGALMMRCKMRFPKGAKVNPDDPNEIDAGNGGSTPIIAPDEEDAYVYDEGEYGSTGVNGYIKEYKGRSQTINIPSAIKGKKVRAIGADVFKNKNIKQIKLPSGVEVIGENAFYNNYIDEVEIPGSVRIIETGAFENNLIKKLYIPDNVAEIGAGAFAKNALTDVTGMKNVKQIPSRAFFINGRIRMDIPNVREIADNAFGPRSPDREYALLFTGDENKYNLRSKDGAYLINPAKIVMDLYDIEVKKYIKRGLEIIGEDSSGNAPADYRNTNPTAYYYTCDGREVDVKAPKIIGYANMAVSRKVKLENLVNNVRFDYSDIELMVRGPLFEGDREIIALGAANMDVEILKNGISTAQSTIDKDGYLILETEPLQASDKIRFVTRDHAGNEHTSDIFEVQPRPANPEGSAANLFILDRNGFLVRYLGDDKNPVIPASVNRRTIYKIAPLAFCNMGIKSVDFSNNTSLDEIGNGAFARNNLREIVFPAGMLHYGKKSFEYNKLQSVQLSPHAHLINEQAFHGNEIKEIGIPGTVAHIRPAAFMDNRIERVTLPKRLETVEAYAFANNRLKEVNFADALPGEPVEADEEFELLEEGVFMSNDLTEVKIPSTVKKIAPNAFAKNGRAVNLISENSALEAADYVDAADLGHIVNGVKVRFSYKKYGGEELLPSEIMVGQDLTDRTSSDLARYYRVGANVRFEPKAISGYQCTPQTVELKPGILNEVEFIYTKASSGGSSGGASGGGTSGSTSGNTDSSASGDTDVKKDDKKKDSSENTDLPGVKFIDLENHWAKAACYHGTGKGYFKGTAEKLFSPQRDITRGEVVTVLGRIDGVNKDDFIRNVFPDVKEDMYYAAYINWAYENKIVSGYPDGSFNADGKISRAEMAVIFNAFIEYRKTKLPGLLKKISSESDALGKAEPKKAYRDAANIKSWAEKSVNRLAEYGVMNGDPAGNFNPAKFITRAECAQLLYNFDKLTQAVDILLLFGGN